jgi:pimeloyl-ACP methyl ester carboxylesterase
VTDGARDPRRLRWGPSDRPGHRPSRPTPAGGRRAHPTPIIAVPGLGLSRELSDRILNRLPGRSAVVLLPGFGLPALRDDPRSPPDLAQLLLAHLDGLGHDRVVLLGHSASCQIVVHAAAQVPNRVEALVLVGPTTDPRARTWPRLMSRWLRTAAWEQPKQIPLLLRDYRQTGIRAMTRGMNAARKDRIDHVLPAVDTPVLIMRGPHDHISPRRWTRELVTASPQGQTETLPAGAHMVPFTHPDALAERIKAFLGNAVAPRRA